MSKISKELKEFKTILELEDEDYINEEEIEKYDLHLLVDKLTEEAFYLDDSRDYSYIKHGLEDILITVILAFFANCNTFVEIHLFAQTHYEWLKKYVGFYDGLPSISTFRRVISVLNPKELEEMCNKVFFNFVKSIKEYIYETENLKITDINAIDGKTANNSERNTNQGYISKTNAMSVYSVKYEKCLATEFIPEKTNEIPTAPILLSRLNIKNVAITFDALNTQKSTIKYIVENGGYYVAPVKDNHSTLFNDLTLYFNDKVLLQNKNLIKFTKLEKAHNQEEKRTYMFINDIEWIDDEWDGLKSIGIVIKEVNGMEIERRYFISNIGAQHIEILSNIIRNEWSIENKLHWYLDMVFQEDRNKAYLKNSQKNFNIIRKFCLGILKIVKSQYNLSMNSIRFKLSMNFEKELENLISML